MNYLRKYKRIVYVPNLYGVFQFLLLEDRPIKDTLIFHDRFNDDFLRSFAVLTREIKTIICVIF